MATHSQYMATHSQYNGTHSHTWRLTVNTEAYNGHMEHTLFSVIRCKVDSPLVNQLMQPWAARSHLCRKAVPCSERLHELDQFLGLAAATKRHTKQSNLGCYNYEKQLATIASHSLSLMRNKFLLLMRNRLLQLMRNCLAIDRLVNSLICEFGISHWLIHGNEGGPLIDCQYSSVYSVWTQISRLDSGSCVFWVGQRWDLLLLGRLHLWDLILR